MFISMSEHPLDTDLMSSLLFLLQLSRKMTLKSLVSKFSESLALSENLIIKFHVDWWLDAAIKKTQLSVFIIK